VVGLDIGEVIQPEISCKQLFLRINYNFSVTLCCSCWTHTV